jgi:hypothetical protein
VSIVQLIGTLRVEKKNKTPKHVKDEITNRKEETKLSN